MNISLTIARLFLLVTLADLLSLPKAFAQQAQPQYPTYASGNVSVTVSAQADPNNPNKQVMLKIVSTVSCNSNTIPVLQWTGPIQAGGELGTWVISGFYSVQLQAGQESAEVIAETRVYYLDQTANNGAGDWVAVSGSPQTQTLVVNSGTTNNNFAFNFANINAPGYYGRSNGWGTINVQSVTIASLMPHRAMLQISTDPTHIYYQAAFGVQQDSTVTIGTPGSGALFGIPCYLNATVNVTATVYPLNNDGSTNFNQPLGTATIAVDTNPQNNNGSTLFTISNITVNLTQ